MSAQPVGVLTAGTEPPPESTLPSLSVVIALGSAATSSRSAWVIWPIFSFSLILLSRSRTRCPIGSEASS